MRKALAAAVALVAALATPVQASNGTAADVARPHLAAAAWYLVGEDDSVLAQHNPRDRRPIASITKLMTAVVTLEHARLSDVVTVGAVAAGIGESTVFLRPGERLTVADLLRGMLVRSANDAAEALALHVGAGSAPRFVSLMNEKARQLGLTDTTFVNPHGLDEPGHLSSARDTTLLVRYALGIPFVHETLDRSVVVLPGGRVFPTTDDLLDAWPPLVGGKTGHTAGAGWSEAAAARRGGATVYGTVLGSASRSTRNDALHVLLEYGLERYRPVAVVDPSRVYAEVETGYGRAPVELVAPKLLVRAVREGMPLVERVVVPASLALPVAKGRTLGSVDIYAGNRLVAASRLVAAADVSEPGVVGKIVWYSRRTVHHLWELVT
jgi:D-alanyl-D-alanine carboxypeptidase (penicillin-binding protein 5/6)